MMPCSSTTDVVCLNESMKSASSSCPGQKLAFWESVQFLNDAIMITYEIKKVLEEYVICTPEMKYKCVHSLDQIHARLDFKA